MPSWKRTENCLICKTKHHFHHWTGAPAEKYLGLEGRREEPWFWPCRTSDSLQLRLTLSGGILGGWAHVAPSRPGTAPGAVAVLPATSTWRFGDVGPCPPGAATDAIPGVARGARAARVSSSIGPPEDRSEEAALGAGTRANAVSPLMPRHGQGRQPPGPMRRAAPQLRGTSAPPVLAR